MINRTRLVEDLGLTNVETQFIELTRQGILVFNNISVEYNNTNIQCRATLSNGETADSNNFTLLVQGERTIIEDRGGWGQEMNELTHSRMNN